MNILFLRDLPLALRLARRELRGGAGGFYVLVICILLGVAAITTVGGLSTALHNGLQDQGRVLLGGDLSFELVHRAPSRAQREFIARHGEISEVSRLRSIARTVDGARAVLVDIKAVDAAYPLTGALVTQEGEAGEVLQQGRLALVDKLLLQRLGLSIGDELMLGEGRVKVAGTIAVEPDRLTGRFSIGPRVLISLQTLAATGLVQPGSLVRHELRLKLDAREGQGLARIEKVMDEIKARFPQAGFTIRDRSNPTPATQRAIDRFSQFLALISLAALFIGGVGVANAVASHIARKRETIATFKSLGAGGRVIFLTYLLQILMLAALGIALGLALGLIIPPLLNLFLGARLPVPLHFGVPVKVLALATAYGFLVALIFMLWPLGATRRIRAAELYRSEVSDGSARPGWWIIVVILGLVAVLAGLVVYSAQMKLISLLAWLTFLVLYFAFLGLAHFFRWMVRRMPRPDNPRLAMVRASLAGPTPLLRTTILSLGIGLSLLVTASLVQNSLLGELETGLPSKAPNFFVLDIDKSDLGRFTKIAERQAPGLSLQTAPMLRGRLVRLAGKPAEQITPNPRVEWVLRGDRGLTFAPDLPKGSVLTQGAWWPKDYDGPPLVSFEQKIAEGLGLTLGDTVTVNVLGRDITAKIANLRLVKWESLSINFVMVFSPNSLQQAPYKLMATLSLRDQDNVVEEGRLISALVQALPDITPIAVREVMAAVDRVLQGVLAAVRTANLVLLLVGAVALAGAMAASHNARIRETVIFKVLGATRKRILLVHLMEYLVLALLSAALALVLGGLAAWGIVTFGMKLPFSFSWAVPFEIAALVLMLILPLGLLGTWRILGQSSTAHLRNPI